ncbi:MAG: thioredoxin-like domain-containing protein [Chthoniobacterales bacterium]
MTIRHLIAISIALAVPALHAASDVRSWTSRDGTATIEAKFHKIEGSKITLILPNGRAQYVEKPFLSEADLAWIEEQAASEITAASAAASPDAKIPAALAGNLLDDRGDAASILNADGSAPKHYLFYYSASWCGPCVAFSPDLVRFYKKMKGRGASFETVLVPSDKTRDAEVAYLKDHRMPWPGIDLDKSPVREVPNNTYGYIPSMILTDADGNILLSVSKDLSRDDFLDQAEKMLSESGDVASR